MIVSGSGAKQIQYYKTIRGKFRLQSETEWNEGEPK